MDDIFKDNIGLFELFILSIQNCFLFYFSKYIVPLQFYTPRCLYNLHSRITGFSINMFDPFLSPHPWISVTARMKKRFPLISLQWPQVTTSGFAKCVQTQNLYTAAVQFSFNIPFKSQTLLLFIVSLQTKATIIISGVLTCCDLPSFLGYPQHYQKPSPELVSVNKS